eukprot:gnl/Chilomastix_caulleri/940.p1 GENE.gnl/Chilomastix_caulleri/940~~gnl/Chilomastix_caulleri/940.p1  ORF type:complete len:220 (+),score=83.61 gnl/Chilomastix_caulleri/940:284-943(+)
MVPSITTIITTEDQQTPNKTNRMKSTTNGDYKKQGPRREIKGSDIVFGTETNTTKEKGNDDFDFNRNDVGRKNIPFPGLDSTAGFGDIGEGGAFNERRDIIGKPQTGMGMEMNTDVGAMRGDNHNHNHNTNNNNNNEHGTSGEIDTKGSKETRTHIQPQFLVAHDTEDMRKKAFEQLKTMDPHVDDKKGTWDGSGGFFDDLETWSEPSQAWNTKRNWHK